MIASCKECQDFRGCSGKDWYSYGEIRFCPQHIFWILKYAQTLEEGFYPDPENLGETAIGSRTIQKEAYFVKYVILIGQVRFRLRTTGWRGRLLAEECINREKMNYLSDDAKSALYYASGKPKTRKFSDWVKDRNYERGKRKAVHSV